tara:strand:+ start:125 stop:403 length:279 start_codon:yes stop_codon:yes gene_type:complete
MAKRIGKYKVGKRESALSIFSETSIATSNVYLTGLSSPTATSSLSPNQVFRTGSAIFSSSIGTIGAGQATPLTAMHFDVLCIRNADGSTGGH